MQKPKQRGKRLPKTINLIEDLCVLGKLVLRGTRIVFPASYEAESLHLHMKDTFVVCKHRLRTKV